MRVVLFGDGLWAVKCLDRLIEDGHSVVALVLREQPSEECLKSRADELRIPIYNPRRVNCREFLEVMHGFDSELNISVSYNQIFKSALIRSARLGTINVHAGGLPAYRGRNVINWAIINNERRIGITVHFVDEGIDTGDILIKRFIPIEWEDSYGTLLEKIQGECPSVLSDAINYISNGGKPVPQKEELGFYVGGRHPGDEWIDWEDTSLNIYNKIRAITYPGPGAKTMVNQKPIVIWNASYDKNWPKYIATPGEVVGRVPSIGVKVKTRDSIIVLCKAQFSGVSGEPFIPSFSIGTRFGHNWIEIINRLQEQVDELKDSINDFKRS